MANMLIRTRHLQWKHRVAVIIRVVLFFGIPTCYLLFGGSADGGDDIQPVGIGKQAFLYSIQEPCKILYFLDPKSPLPHVSSKFQRIN